MRILLKKLAFALSLCAFSGCVFAQQGAKPAPSATKPGAKPPAQLSKQSLFKAQHFDQAAISPDGKSVAWVEIRADEDGGWAPYRDAWPKRG